MKFVIFHSDYEYYKFLFGRTITKRKVINVYGSRIMTKNFLLQFLYRLHHSSLLNKYFNIPLKNIWYSYLIPAQIAKDDDVCFIFNSSRVSNIDFSFYNYLRAHYKCKLVLQLWNPIDWDRGKVKYDIEEMKNIMDMVCTYNVLDAQKYKVTLYPYILFQLKNIIVKPFKDRHTDVLFIGQDKGRMQYIENLYRSLASRGLRCDFYIINPLRECQVDEIHICEWISYLDLIKKTEDTKCIVNILQAGAEGITIRDIEAYNYGCYMITNNPLHELNDIFHAEQLVNIDNISDNIIQQIKNRKNPFEKRLNTNTLDNFLNWTEESLIYSEKQQKEAAYE